MPTREPPRFICTWASRSEGCLAKGNADVRASVNLSQAEEDDATEASFRQRLDILDFQSLAWTAMREGRSPVMQHAAACTQVIRPQ